MITTTPFRQDQAQVKAASAPLAAPAPMCPGIPGTNPGPSAEIPAYRIHRTKGLGYVRIQGRMLYLGKANTPDSLAQYRRLVGEWLVSGRVQSSKDKTGERLLPIAQLVDAYLDWAKHYYIDAEGQQSGGLTAVTCAARLLKELYGTTAAGEFGPIALKAVRQGMIDKGLCRNVVNQRVGYLKRIFRWAVGEELVSATVLHALSAISPLRRERSAARETDPVRPVPDEHVEVVLPYLPPTLVAMARLQRMTGMRSGELCILRTRDLDTTAAVWIYRPATHKTAHHGHERLVRIGPKGQAVLRPYLRAATPMAFVFSPERAQCERHGQRDVTSPEGAGHLSSRESVPVTTGRYSPRSYRRALCYAMRRAIRAGALKPDQCWHPHQLRHRHATQIRQARGLEAARVLLGHRTLSQTLEYAEADAALAASLAQELG